MKKKQKEHENLGSVPLKHLLKKHRFKTIFFWSMGLFVSLILFLFSLYWLPQGEYQRIVFRYVPLPIGTAGGNWFTSYSLPAKSFATRQNFISGVTNAGTLAQLTSIAKVHNTSVNNKDKSDALDELITREANGNEASFDTILKESYHTDRQEFLDFWLPLSLYNQKLSIWFNSQKDLNTDSYQLVGSIENKISRGEDFALLAKQYSKDESSSAFGGNVGKIYVNSLLPEFRSKLSSARAGDTLVLPSRHGVHIMKVLSVQLLSEEGGNDWLNIQQIFIPTAGFDAWLSSEKQKHVIHYFIKF